MIQSAVSSPDFRLPSHKDDRINYQEILLTLWRGKWLVVFTLLCSIFLGGYYAYGVVKSQYKSSAFLEVTVSESSFLDLTDLVSGTSTDTASLNTDIATIQSREMMAELVSRLGLMEDPEFNTGLLPPKKFTPVLSIKRAVGLIGPARDLSPEEQTARNLRKTIEEVRGRIAVSIERDTYLFKIQAISERPRMAALLSNTLAEIYIEAQLAERLDAADSSIRWLTERVEALQEDLLLKEDEIKTLISRTELISAEDLERVNFQAKKFRERIRERQDTLARIQTDIDLLSQAAASQDKAQVLATISDPIVQRLLSDLTEDLSGPASDRQVFLTRIEQMVEIQASERKRILSEIAGLSTSLEGIEVQFERQSDDQQKIDQMQREIQVTRDLYQTFLTGLQEASVQIGITQSDAKIMSRAIPPEFPFAPRRASILVSSACIGFLLAAIFLLIQETLQNHLRSVDSIAAVTTKPVLGEIPLFPKVGRNNLLTFLRENPTSPAIEALRNLRTSLLMTNVDTPPQVCLVTSSVPGEGKTTMSLSLAHSLAGLEKRVLVIEADIRRRPFQKYFAHLAFEHNLIDVVQGSASLEDAVVHDTENNFHALLGGATSVNAADLFSSEKFKAVLAQAREQFDYIIIDSPPVLAVPDARILASQADLILFVARWNQTTPQVLRKGLENIELGGNTYTGIALSQIDVKRMRGYGGYYNQYSEQYS